MIKILLAIFFLINLTNAKIGCRNEKNETVDWYVAIKYPHNYKFVYYSSESTNEWVIPQYNISRSSSIVGLTINQAYKAEKNGDFYAFYNDESGTKNYGSRGHLKGVLNFDKNSGYWLIHSIPKFPASHHYEYNHSERIYGQSMICISLATSNLANIASQLMMMQSSVYSSNLPSGFANDHKVQELLQQFIDNKSQKYSLYNSMSLKSVGGMNFQHFGKSKGFDRDLYSELVAQKLKSSLFVETWIRGEKVPSSCQKNYKVYNVQRVKLINTSYKESSDHSKWVVSENRSIICVGDINRMTSQYHRGGGTMCLTHHGIWNLFKRIILKYEHCQ